MIILNNIGVFLKKFLLKTEVMYDSLSFMRTLLSNFVPPKILK